MDYVPITERNRPRVNALIRERWLSLAMVVRGEVVDMTKAGGFLALEAGEIAGLVTYFISGSVMEITSLDSLAQGKGIGTALLGKAVAAAREAGCARVTLVTTNDNIDALLFYQKRGFDMARLYRDALEVSRKLKPEIPLVGGHGIPLRHEIEFEMIL